MLLRLYIMLLFLVPYAARANYLLIPMDQAQSNHLKAYGIAFMMLKEETDVDWLLNYRGGSFMIQYNKKYETECKLREVYFEVISDANQQQIVSWIEQPDRNMSVVKLHKAARIAVYSPLRISPSEFENTDAVLLALKFAEIPFELLYDEEILKGELSKYDWVHLHHEDFTGQFGKNLRRMSELDIKAQESIAHRMGYTKVSQMKLAVAKAIKDFCLGGGYLFAMCSGAETFDIALASEGVDIVDGIDGDGADQNAQDRLDFEKTFAFFNFKIDLENQFGMSFSDINHASGMRYRGSEDEAYFSLFDFSAKWDIIPSMLVQNHEHHIREFFGQTSAFSSHTVKPDVLIMGQSKTSDRYIYGEMGRGQWTFYGGHDPEGRQGGRRMSTDLALYPNSPGYRLILNNVLFPSARKKKRKT